MQGRRLYPPADAYPRDFETQMEPGDYALFWNRIWLMRAPNGDWGACGNYINKGPHRITEHEDGTITVYPSLQFETGSRWHGWLERGKWRDA